MSIVYLTQCGSFHARHGHGGTLNEEIHSHNFHYEITFHGHTNAEGYLLDFRDLADIFKLELESSLEGRDLALFCAAPPPRPWQYGCSTALKNACRTYTA